MQFIALTLLASLASTGAFAAKMHYSRQSCPEAARFGNLIVNPTTVKPGDSMSITSTFNCTSQFGIVPNFIEYSLMVPSNVNNGHEPNIILDRHEFKAPATGVPVDQATVTIPTWPGYFKGADYNVAMTITYAFDNGDGTQTQVEGGVLQPITLDGGN